MLCNGEMWFIDCSCVVYWYLPLDHYYSNRLFYPYVEMWGNYMYNLITDQSTGFFSIVHDVSNTHNSRSHFTSCLLELVIPYKCVYYLLK